MSRTYATPLLLEPGPSRSLRGWLVLIHIVAIMLLPFLSLPFLPGLLLLLLLLFSFWRSPGLVSAVQWNETCSCRLRLSSGLDVDARLLPQFFMLPWLVIMHFRSEQGRLYHMVLLSDMLEPLIFRRLRVRLMTELNKLDA